MSFHPYPNNTEKNLWQKHSSHLLFKNSKFSTLSMQVLVSSHMEVEETSKGRKYKEQCWCHNLWHNLYHNSPMWRVVIGRSPHGPTIILPPTKTRHMGKLWHQYQSNEKQTKERETTCHISYIAVFSKKREKNSHQYYRVVVSDSKKRI